MKAVGTPDNDREGDGLMVIERHFPTVAVAEVLEDDSLRIDRTALLLGRIGGMAFGSRRPEGKQDGHDGQE